MRTKFAIAVLLAVVAGLFSSAPASSVPVNEASTDVGLMSAGCGTTAPDLDTVKENVSDPAKSAANQRTGSSTSCVSLGVLQLTDNADYYCYTWESGSSYSWTYLRNLRTGVKGWVRDDLLKDNGSYRHCGF